MNSPVVLVTGAMGCIGAWVVTHLIRQGRATIASDLSDNHHRLDMLLSPEEQSCCAIVARSGRIELSHWTATQEHRELAQIPGCGGLPEAK